MRYMMIWGHGLNVLWCFPFASLLRRIPPTFGDGTIRECTGHRRNGRDPSMGLTRQLCDLLAEAVLSPWIAPVPPKCFM